MLCPVNVPWIKHVNRTEDVCEGPDYLSTLIDFCVLPYIVQNIVDSIGLLVWQIYAFITISVWTTQLHPVRDKASIFCNKTEEKLCHHLMRRRLNIWSVNLKCWGMHSSSFSSSSTSATHPDVTSPGLFDTLHCFNKLPRHWRISHHGPLPQHEIVGYVVGQ